MTRCIQYYHDERQPRGTPSLHLTMISLENKYRAPNPITYPVHVCISRSTMPHTFLMACTTFAAPPTLCSVSDACGLLIWPPNGHIPNLAPNINNRPATMPCTHHFHQNNVLLTAVAIYIVWGHTGQGAPGPGPGRERQKSGQTAVIIKRDPR